MPPPDVVDRALKHYFRSLKSTGSESIRETAAGEEASAEPNPAARHGRDLPSQERVKRSKKRRKAITGKDHAAEDIQQEGDNTSPSLDPDQRFRRKRQSKAWVWKTLLAVILLTGFSVPAFHLLLRDDIDFSKVSAELIEEAPQTGQQQQGLSPREILEAHTTATGISQLNSLSSEWSMDNNGQSGVLLEECILPDRLRRIVISDQNFEAISLFDRQLWLWGRQNGQDKNILRANNQRLQRFIELNLLLRKPLEFFEEFPDQFSLQESTMVEGVAHQTLRFSDDTDIVVDMIFDPVTHYEVQRVFYYKRGASFDFIDHYFFEDFQDNKGIILPHKRISIQTDDSRETIELVELSVNPTFRPNFFAPGRPEPRTR